MMHLHQPATARGGETRLMTIPLQVHLGEVADAPRVEAEIARGLARLERYSDEIQRCQVWVEAPHGHHLQGRLYEVRMRLAVPDEEIVVHHQPADDDVHALVHRAFDAARRQLQDYVRRRRRDVARHGAARRKPGQGGL
jgi:ribosome-associated translation inhibitor RaiA